jgi:hypothetical protein
MTPVADIRVATPRPARTFFSSLASIGTLLCVRETDDRVIPCRYPAMNYGLKFIVESLKVKPGGGRVVDVIG